MKKKFAYAPGGTMSLLEKNLLKMKLTLLCLLFGIIQLMANDVFSQSARISLNVTDARVEDVLMKIEEQSNLYFIYNRNAVDVNRKVSVSCTDQKLSDILSGLFKGTSVSFEIQDRHIILKNNDALPGQQQPKSVSGTVKDLSGVPIPGVTVLVKGTSKGTITDASGKFSLANVETSDILVFSFVGLKTQEIAVDYNNNFNITMTEDAIGIEEVVAIGYGTVKRADLTGATVKVGANDFNKGVLEDPIEALQGKVAGVSISKQGGDPNTGFSIKVRGSAGMGSGTEPLYVVDGVPGIDPNTIAPEDIESFDILKDASSAAIYGSRGSNGVVMITTKKGNKNKGKAQLEYNTYFASESVLKRLDLMSAGEYRAWTQKSGKTEYDDGNSTDWQDVIFRNGLTQNHNIAISNSWETGNYRISVTYNDLQGVVKATDNQTTSVRANLQQDFLDNKLRTTAIIAQTYEKQHMQDYSGAGQSDVLYQAYARNPTYPVYNSSYTSVTDMYNQDAPGLYASNPLAYIKESQNEQSGKASLFSLGIEADILKGLTGNVKGSYYRNDYETWNYKPTYLPGSNDGYGKRAYYNTSSKIFESYFNYKNVFAKNSIDAVAGYSYQEDGEDDFSALGYRSSSDYTQADNLGMLAISKTISSNKESSRLISFFGRINYDFDKKYYFTGTLRRDGSSKFGKNHEWGYFPSFSAAWDISKENFMKGVDFLNFLKLRGGIGVSGNQDIDNYLYETTYVPNGTTIDESGNTIVSLAASRNANPDLKWEQTTEYTMGLDFGLLKDKISGGIDLYKKVTSDLLYNYAVSVPPNLYSTTWANAGEVQNKGIEAQVTAIAISKKSFTWKSNAVFSLNRQKFTKLGDGDTYSLTALYEGGLGSVQGMTSTKTQIIKVGGAIGDFYGPKCVGIDSGNYLYETEDGGTTTDVSNAATKKLGSALPKFELGWTNTFTYKNFDLAATLRGEFGHKKLNATRMWFGNPTVLDNGINGLKEASELYGTLTSSPQYSSYYIENASYVRMTNLQLGYNLPTKTFHNVISRFRIYFAANNVFTITNYKGLDPESQVVNKSLETGVEVFNIYPKTRSFSLGLNVSL